MGWVLPEDETISLRAEQDIDLRHHLKGIGDIEHVGFAARSSAVGIEIDGAPFANEAPADSVRRLAMAAGGRALGMARR